jgi:hypothetical protein
VGCHRSWVSVSLGLNSTNVMNLVCFTGSPVAGNYEPDNALLDQNSVAEFKLGFVQSACNGLTGALPSPVLLWPIQDRLTPTSQKK